MKQQRGALIDVHLNGINLVANGGYAYLAVLILFVRKLEFTYRLVQGKSNLESSLYEDYLRTGTCRLSIAQQEFFKVNVAFAFSKNSALKPFMDEKYKTIWCSL